MKLNVGCGKDVREGYINLDAVKHEGVDVAWDLNKFPYPFEDSSMDEIIAKAILEHVNDAKQTIEELWRIAKPNANIYVEVPHFTSPTMWQDLTHVRPFGRYSFDYYSTKKSDSKSLNSTPDGCPVKFEIEVNYLFNRYFKYSGIKLFFNTFTKLYEQILCWIFPCGLMEFNLKVIKETRDSE